MHPTCNKHLLVVVHVVVHVALACSTEHNPAREGEGERESARARARQRERVCVFITNDASLRTSDRVQQYPCNALARLCRLTIRRQCTRRNWCSFSVRARINACTHAKRAPGRATDTCGLTSREPACVSCAPSCVSCASTMRSMDEFTSSKTSESSKTSNSAPATEVQPFMADSQGVFSAGVLL